MAASYHVVRTARPIGERPNEKIKRKIPFSVCPSQTLFAIFKSKLILILNNAQGPD